ncbi:hypothetical protein [Leptospira brenneri]|uniref:Uncharacterized protein n=1 Tax=Leptospira brenneri TaxID=2023182 RepID=A0A2M9XYY5_9LEPT|nr:hypothetical protein [Leptospira brenneri]PJZ44542.1 hypothetical protein CH361_15730 [Leptospira brenneri]TGK95546.1 hypothetical protein EHQ30_02585 [Leptospira brenneri]
MQRLDFLKKLSFSALVVAGVHSQIRSETTKTAASQPKTLPNFLSTYPMDAAEEITTSIVRKIFKPDIELDSFLELFAEELNLRYPFDEKRKSSSYRELYFASIRSEVVFQISVIIVEVWRNLCLQIGLEYYTLQELESDSKQIQNDILEFGNKFRLGEIPHFILENPERLGLGRSKVSFFVTWFGTKKEEILFYDPTPLQMKKEWRQYLREDNSMDNHQVFLLVSLEFLENLLSRLAFFQANWHQYVVRFYYLSFVEKELENQTKIEKKKKTKFPLWIRYVTSESAVQTIKERAFHMQSGVYHAIDRQHQQMVVSSLVQVIGQVSVATGGDKDVCKKLRFVNEYGGIVTVSTAANATDSLPLIEDALRILQKERKLYFP